MVMQAGIRTQEVNPAKLGMLYRKEFELSRVRPGETVILLTDLSTRREYIEASFAAADEYLLAVTHDLPPSAFTSHFLPPG